MVPRLFYNRNENIFGPAPLCVDAWRKFSRSKAALYEDGYFRLELADALAREFGVNRNSILVGYGSEDILRDIVNALLRPKDILLLNQYHFGFFDQFEKIAGYAIREFKLLQGRNSFAFDIDDLISKFKKLNPPLTIIASPNNPTGHTIDDKGLERFLGVCHRSGSNVVVLDEAYYGFGAGLSKRRIRELIAAFPNFIITRTFSKFYALAGLRVGFAFAGESARRHILYQPPYLGFSRILERVAIAALQSEKYYKRVSEEIQHERSVLIRAINQLDFFRAYQSYASFIFMEFLEKKLIPSFRAAILETDVHIAKFVDDRFLRISISLPKYNRQFIVLLRRLENDIKKRLGPP